MEVNYFNTSNIRDPSQSFWTRVSWLLSGLDEFGYNPGSQGRASRFRAPLRTDCKFPADGGFSVDLLYFVSGFSIRYMV